MRSRRVGFLAGSVSLVADFPALGQEQEPPRIPAGVRRVIAEEHVDIHSEFRAIRDFLVAVRELTTNIVDVLGKEDWFACVSSDAGKQEHNGIFERPNIPGVARLQGS